SAIELLREKTPAGANHSGLRILVFGGSQGARGINETVLRAVQAGGEWLKGVELVHQTGRADFQRIKQAYAEANAPVDVNEYLHNMARRYAWAVLVVAPPATGPVSDLAACGKAAILVPLPTAADNHQQRNAEALVAKGGAMMVLQREFTPE